MAEVDTSREAVEALIVALRSGIAFTDVLRVASKTLAAVLDERDRLAANRDAWVSDAMTSTTELEQRIRDLEAERDGLEDSLSARDVELQQDALRIRDLEATVDNLRLISNANGDWNIKYQEVNHRAERAETELLHARGISEIRGAERDRLAAKLDAMKAEIDGQSPFGEYVDPAPLRAILADTDEGKSNGD